MEVNERTNDCQDRDDLKRKTSLDDFEGDLSLGEGSAQTATERRGIYTDLHFNLFRSCHLAQECTQRCCPHRRVSGCEVAEGDVDAKARRKEGGGGRNP